MRAAPESKNMSQREAWVAHSCKVNLKGKVGGLGSHKGSGRLMNLSLVRHLALTQGYPEMRAM